MHAQITNNKNTVYYQLDQTKKHILVTFFNLLIGQILGTNTHGLKNN